VIPAQVGVSSFYALLVRPLYDPGRSRNESVRRSPSLPVTRRSSRHRASGVDALPSRIGRIAPASSAPGRVSDRRVGRPQRATMLRGLRTVTGRSADALRHHPGRRGFLAARAWSASRPRRTKPDWATTRSATTGPGTPTSPWPCSPPPTSPPPAPTPTRPSRVKGGPTPGENGLIPLLANEIRRLLATLALAPTICVDTVIRWSLWRRRRQHQARTSHYHRRGQRPPP
jgi:hypothetical protein